MKGEGPSEQGLRPLFVSGRSPHGLQFLRRTTDGRSFGGIGHVRDAGDSKASRTWSRAASVIPSAQGWAVLERSLWPRIVWIAGALHAAARRGMGCLPAGRGGVRPISAARQQSAQPCRRSRAPRAVGCRMDRPCRRTGGSRCHQAGACVVEQRHPGCGSGKTHMRGVPGLRRRSFHQFAERPSGRYCFNAALSVSIVAFSLAFALSIV